MSLNAGKDVLRCDYCETLHFPEVNSDGVRVLDVDSEYACPCCAEAKLVHASIGGERVLNCRRCRGLLIGMSVFAALIEELRSRHQMSEYAGKQPDWDELKRLVKCPQCTAPMDAHPYAGPGAVIIDSCSDCGLNWLDYGELQRIVRAPDRRFVMPIDDDERQRVAALSGPTW
jgi:Zn-finger nucleic acid-binding protein